jgi:hypothetical protein
MSNDNKAPVIITTNHRGVFFGYVDQAVLDEDKPRAHIKVSGARMCLYWAQSVGGVLGLASNGPNSDCRISARAPAVVLRDITAVMECSPQAADRWESAPCVK